MAIFLMCLSDHDFFLALLSLAWLSVYLTSTAWLGVVAGGIFIDAGPNYVRRGVNPGVYTHQESVN
jgi:hypothetical protein